MKNEVSRASVLRAFIFSFFSLQTISTVLAAFTLKKSFTVRSFERWRSKGLAKLDIKASPCYISSLARGNTLALHRNSLFLLPLLTHTLLRLVNYRLFLANRTNCPTSMVRRFDATARSSRRNDTVKLHAERRTRFYVGRLLLFIFPTTRKIGTRVG